MYKVVDFLVKEAEQNVNSNFGSHVFIKNACYNDTNNVTEGENCCPLRAVPLLPISTSSSYHFIWEHVQLQNSHSLFMLSWKDQGGDGWAILGRSWGLSGFFRLDFSFLTSFSWNQSISIFHASLCSLWSTISQSNTHFAFHPCCFTVKLLSVPQDPVNK